MAPAATPTALTAVFAKATWDSHSFSLFQTLLSNVSPCPSTLSLCCLVYACSILQDRLPGRHIYAGAGGSDDIHNAGVPAEGLCSHGRNNILAADAAAMWDGSYEGEAAVQLHTKSLWG